MRGRDDMESHDGHAPNLGDGHERYGQEIEQKTREGDAVKQRRTDGQQRNLRCDGRGGHRDRRPHHAGAAGPRHDPRNDHDDSNRRAEGEEKRRVEDNERRGAEKDVADTASVLAGAPR